MKPGKLSSLSYIHSKGAAGRPTLFFVLDDRDVRVSTYKEIVTADHGRNLATRNADATREIDNVIATIALQTVKAASDIGSGRTGMDCDNELIRSIGVPLRERRDNSQTSLNDPELLDGVAQGLVASSQAISDNATQMFGMSAHNPAAADQVATIPASFGGTAERLRILVDEFCP